MSLNVRVLTPDKVVWDAKAEELVLPSSTGKLVFWWTTPRY